MLDSKKMKLLGMVTTIVGMGLTIVNSWIDDKAMDIRIAEAVKEALESVKRA